MFKDAAIAFLKLAASGQVNEAYEKHVARDFRHHNAYYPGDRDSLMKGMQENSEQFPLKVFDVKRAIEEGEFVAVHSRVKMTGTAQDIAVVHILRFGRDGRIVEMWDIGQQVPAETPNKYGVF